MNLNQTIKFETERMIDALQSHQDLIATDVSSIVDQYWIGLAKAIKSGASQHDLLIASRIAFTKMTEQIQTRFVKKLNLFLDSIHDSAVSSLLNNLPKQTLDAMVGEVLPVGQSKKKLKTAIFDSKQVNPGQIIKSVITDTTNLGNPDDITRTINSMRMQGKTTKQIASAIRPQVYGVKSTVNRIVRDSTAFAGTVENLSTWNALPQGMVIGYQVHAVPRTKYSRIEHLQRSGTIYYAEPKADEKGYNDMPQPPYDRVNGQFVLERNCRCWLSPVFSNEFQIIKKSA